MMFVVRCCLFVGVEVVFGVSGVGGGGGGGGGGGF